MGFHYASHTIKRIKERNKKISGARLAVEAIEYDICDRRGLKWEWQGIDPEIRDTIKRVWIQIIKQAMREERKKGNGQ